MACHEGSTLEHVSTLSTFGIPRNILPIQICDDSLNLEHHNEWIGFRTTLERQARTGDILQTVIPGNIDVLLGSRGKAIENNGGNIRLYHLIETFSLQYENCAKFEKTVVIECVLSKLKEEGRRFLKKTPAGWVQVSDEKEGRDKIGHGFRNYRARGPSKRKEKRRPESR